MTVNPPPPGSLTPPAWQLEFEQTLATWHDGVGYSITTDDTEVVDHAIAVLPHVGADAVVQYLSSVTAQ